MRKKDLSKEEKEWLGEIVGPLPDSSLESMTDHVSGYEPNL